ncbi:MAG: hypothetical protein HZA61_06595 [Candidatus Eisenbacteria bacterium]|uniref:HEAT repeat domain-containing protein n=1 Tax=Eiseniibacteriota bacterium TaxID=2212470 RepID=A0A933W2R4_UNCEI|nr:hypothetical protein [Candidatus Eisenbacteria bacterium]
MKYQEPTPFSRESATAILHGDDVDAMCHALVGVAFHEPDWRWVQGECLRLLVHSAPAVRGLAATCLGHLARIHGEVDRALVEPALRLLLSDPEVGGRAEDALQDIERFCER